MLQIVNMIPKSLSGETDQDSEPNLAVNPEQPDQIVATAFTRDPMNGNRAPVYVSQSSTGPLGQERIGADLAIAVDPSNSDNVWLAWCDRVGGATGTDRTMHVCHSTDRGQTWGNRNLRTVTNAKNPTLAVNANGLVGLMFQQLVGAGPAGRWVTQLETSATPTSPPRRCSAPTTPRRSTSRSIRSSSGTRPPGS